MINQFNLLLRHHFLAQLSEITDGDQQVRFQPPDADWRSAVTGLSAPALNVYLVDIRENRKLRSNARAREAQNGTVTETLPPKRVDCHYLITAWSPAPPSPAVEATLDEQALLYKVAALLMNSDPLNPARIYPPGSSALTAWPEAVREDDLPVQVLPVEGFPKLAEFWGTMGSPQAWRPAVYLIFTLPVVPLRQIVTPAVTTRATRTGETTDGAWIQIGGRVLDATSVLLDGSFAPVGQAWVGLEAPTGELLQTAETDIAGRFVFGGLRIGAYTLRARAPGFAEGLRSIDVPSPDGDYNVRLS